MTVVNTSQQSNLSCSLKVLYSSKKLTRLCWTFGVTLSISFLTYFLYCNINISTNPIQSNNHIPITFSQQQQRYSFDNSLIEGNNILSGSHKYTQQNHNRAGIESLLLESNHILLQDTVSIVDVTVLMNAAEAEYSLINIKTQIKSILAQSIQPKYIYITYTNEATKKSLEKMVKKYNINIQYKFFYSATTVEKGNDDDNIMHVRDASWLLQQCTILTEFTWVLESNTIPDRQYLYYTYGLLNTEEYKSTLIGYETSILFSNNSNQLIKCIQSRSIARTQPVDMIHGTWLLRTSWIQVLRQEVNNNAVIVFDIPLSYFISSSLLYRADISSVAIPSKLKQSSSSLCINGGDNDSKAQNLQLSTFNSVLPNVHDQQNIWEQRKKDGDRLLVLLFDDVDSALELFPLLCKLIEREDKQLHIILTNGLTRLTFQDIMIRMGCIQNHNKYSVIIHDLTMAYNNGINQALEMVPAEYVIPIVRLLEFLQPRVLIQVTQHEEDSFFYYSQAIKSTARIQDIVSIHLPAGQVEHALWISDLSVEALRHWNDIKIDLVVITDKRPQSLNRLLKSTNSAYYLGDDQVELVIHMEQTADKVTRSLVQSFVWEHGDKKMRHRIHKGGLMPAIVESWYPSDNDSYGVLLEDDIELSPFFYSWSKYNILKYRYSPDQADAYQHIYGVSLYSPRNLELLPEGRRPFNPEPVLENSGYSKRAPYASQIPCSWGAVYFPEHWHEFHTYLTERLVKEEWKGYYNITVPKSRSERWKKSWKKYFIELVYLRAYVMIYPNFEQFESFSTNHLETGTHVQENGRTQSKVDQFLVPLMQRDTILEQLPNQKLPTFEHLPVMDLWGNIRTMEDLHQTGSTWHQRVSTCPRTMGTFDPSDLLCPFEENIEEYNNRTEKKR